MVSETSRASAWQPVGKAALWVIFQGREEQRWPWLLPTSVASRRMDYSGETA